MTLTRQCWYLIISSNENVKFKIGENETENSASEKLLGVKLD